MSDLEGQQITAAQRAALEAELADMEGPQRAAAVQAISTAREFGSIVEVEDGDGERMEIEISSVGGVSPDSPLGRALMGAAVGHTVEVPAPRGAWSARIISIRFQS
jgi:transcription elongation GreA/GreB family factor